MPNLKETRPPSRRKATIGNLISQYSAIVLVMVNGILLVPLYLAKIDYVLYSAWLATGNVLAWLSLAEGNLNVLVRREVANAYGERNSKRLGEAIGTGLLINGFVGLLPTLIGILVAWFLPGWLGIKGENARTLILAVSLAAVSVGLTVAAGAPGSVQQGLQRNVAHCVFFVVSALLGIVLTIVLLFVGWGVLSIPLGLIGRFLLENLLRWPYVLFLTKYKLGISITFSWEELRRIFGLTVWTLIEKLGQRLVLNLDALVVGIAMDVRMVPFVVLTKRAWHVVYMLINRVGVAVMPSLAHVKGEGNEKLFRKCSIRLLRFIGVLGGVFVGLTVALNEEFMNIWLAPRDLYPGDAFNILLGVSVFSLVLANNMRQPLFAVGLIKQVSLVSISQSVARAILLALSIYWIGIFAIPVSMLLTVPLVGGGYMLKLFRTELECSMPRLAACFGEIAALLAFGTILGWLSKNVVRSGSWLWLIVDMAITGCVLATTILIASPSGRMVASTVWRRLTAKTRERRIPVNE